MVSSKDVAKMAGVSQSTVSRVLNNPASVKPVTRNKVLNAMKELSYHPNLIARSLVTNSTRTIALITGTLYNGFFVETTNSIINLATSRGFKTLVYFEGAMKLRDVFDSLRGQKVDGILLSSITLDDPMFEEIKRSQIPYMMFNRRPRDGGNYVVLDNLLAGEIITRHLLDLGHQRIAYISGETNVSTFFERKLGVQKALSEAGTSLQPELFHVIDTNPTDVEKVTLKLMHMSQPPTAILCATDAMAFACMDAILSLGLRIPDDVSLAGIDDISMASHHAIQLTSVGHHKFRMGEIAAENLIEMIEHGFSPDHPRQIVLQPELVIRKTTGRKK
ncbi:LacI family DNA-binding transcriptional regulator [Effusibacillus lacus]|uniref:LacI family transcriptional regulator n=1 Tax=Effusibacillus lacus TaxID=1348429 RepID=A0A292YLK9_9BACL|nr:LacI family DNA-binding transcriptional regulator [Effusibacillus lacus]TCS72809.1 LacI family transcriptional regulator [Effusibacillus lacus]GAX89264.1 LacI family transcriptional regulator [Effusibacillus lacus]